MNPLRQGERVVVNLRGIVPVSFAVSTDEAFGGQHGVVVKGPYKKMGSDEAEVLLDGHSTAHPFWLINLRHERDDERPATLETDSTCCCLECGKPAEFEIWDQNERRPDCGSTLACEQHVGVLLGSVPPTKPTGPWAVYAIEKEKDERPAEKKPVPVHMTVALVDGRIKVSVEPAEGEK